MTLLFIIFGIIIIAIIDNAVESTNALKPFNPPPVLFVNKNNEWDTIPGSKRLATCLF